MDIFKAGHIYTVRYEKDRMLQRIKILETDGIYATYRYVDSDGNFTTIERRNKVMPIGGMEVLMADTWVRSDDVETA